MGITQEDRPERTDITASAPGMAEITEFLAREFPQNKCRVLAVGAGGATVAHEVGADELRPGGTVSGHHFLSRCAEAVRVKDEEGKEGDEDVEATLTPVSP